MVTGIRFIRMVGLVVAALVALVAGATGLVGREILARLSADKRYRAIHCVGRRVLPADLQALSQRFASHAVDLTQPANWPDLGAVDDVYIALGTTIAQAGSQAAFRAVDFDAVVAVAQAGIGLGASRIGVVSAMGASSSSTIFYNRVKGEMEAALSALPVQSLVIVRPSMLDGAREQLAQPPRLGERFTLPLMRALAPLIPANYRAVAATDVARSLVQAVLTGTPGRQLLLSAALKA